MVLAEEVTQAAQHVVTWPEVALAAVGAIAFLGFIYFMVGGGPIIVINKREK